MKTCNYCNENNAIIQFKNGKWCCQKMLSRCPEMRKKNSSGGKGKTHIFLNGHHRAMLGKKAWNSGKTLDELLGKARADEYRKKISVKLSGVHILANISPEKEMERRRKISLGQKINPRGGYKRGSGRGKKGWYKGYWCDSSWELAWVIYNVEHSITFHRNLTKFEYSYENKQRFWTPDFQLDNGDYVEIKGYETEQSRSKFRDFKYKLIVLRKTEMAPILQYVVSKYGKNFIRLYEKT